MQHAGIKDSTILIGPSTRNTVPAVLAAAQNPSAPTAPETGYGWLKLGHAAGTSVVPLTRFVEKAQAMMAADKFLWNSGIFMFRVSTIIDAFKAYAPTMLAPVQSAKG